MGHSLPKNVFPNLNLMWPNTYSRGRWGVSQPERLAVPDAEQLSAERSRCLVTEKAEATCLPHFMYSLVCFDSKYTQVKKHWRLGETWEWRVSVTYTLALVCPVLMLGSTLTEWGLNRVCVYVYYVPKLLVLEQSLSAEWSEVQNVCVCGIEKTQWLESW